MPIQPGAYVTSNVRLVKPLGKGGMGSVWVAHHESLDSEVAVKFVAPELAEKDPSMLERFRREAALSAKLKSPHAVTTFDHGVMKDGPPYIVMELLKGETLGSRLQRKTRLTPSQVSVVVLQVAHVLDEAHKLGVVHRDIKPDNIFLLSTGYELFVKVLDFGIAKQTTAAAATVTDTGAIVGTPEYMSPEQLLSTKSADFRADLWSLAVLAYHALTGRVPFRGETLPSLSIEICGGRFVPPSQLIEGLPPALDDWFDRALDPEPSKRFDAVLKMAEAFGRIARGADSSAADSVRTPPRLATSMESAVTERHTPLGETPLPARVSADGDAPQGETLASANVGGDAPLSTPPKVGIEDAASVDSGVRPSFPDAGPDESGRRDAVAATLAAGTSPTFAGAASELEPASEEERRRGRMKLAAVLTAGVLLAFAADYALRRSGPSTTVAASAAPASASDVVASSEEPRAKTPAPKPPPKVAPEAESAQVASSAPAPHRVPGPRPRPTPSAVASAKRGGCENPYVLKKDGTYGVKPECL